jgi:hypothetical protein
MQTMARAMAVRQALECVMSSLPVKSRGVYRATRAHGGVRPTGRSPARPVRT